MGSYFHEAYRFRNDVIFHFKKNQKLMVFSFEKGIEKEVDWEIRADSLYYEGHRFKVIVKNDSTMELFNTVKQTRPNDTTVYNVENRLGFIKINSSFSYNTYPDISLKTYQKVASEQKNNLLKTDDYVLIKENRMYLSRNYYYDQELIYRESETFCTEIKQYEGYYFLIRKRFYRDSCLNISKVEYITKTESGFAAIDFNDPYQPVNFYRLAPAHYDPSKSSHHFHSCNTTHVPLYFQTQTQYSGGLSALKLYFEKKLNNTTPDPQDNGYISIGFTISCKGEMGHFNIQSFNLDYQPATLSKKLTLNLFTWTSELKDWNLRSSWFGESDSYRFITFRFEKGKLAELMP